MALSYIYVISAFILYYLLLLVVERKIIQEPREIIEKFLSVILLYAGISLIYFAFTGKPFPGGSLQEYNIYIFIIGFIAALWAVPTLLKEFGFFTRFITRRKFRVEKDGRTRRLKADQIKKM